MFLYRVGDLAGMRGRLLDNMISNLFLAALKQDIVLGKIRVTKHVRSNQGIFLEAVVVR
jgi:hypothetical protein